MELREGQDISPDRVPCQFCSRKFVPASLAKHAKVCEKMLHKKRKTFDSAKQRIQGTELAEFLPTVPKRSEVTVQVKEKPLTVPKNTDAHVPARKHSKVTSPMSKSASNYEKCPYCDRNFGPKAFDRHTEWCKEQSIRINLKNTATTQEAKERLEARTKYRAPMFKSRRSVTREKYSPKVSQESHIIVNKLEELPRREKYSHKSLDIDSKPKSNGFAEKPKPKEKETNFIRQNMLRCSYRNKLPKKTENKTEKDVLNNNRRKSDFNGVQTWIAANGTKIRPSLQPSKVTQNSVNKQLIDVLCDSYNPYILAEHQMKELFNDVNANIEEPLNETYTLNKFDTSNSPMLSKEEKRNKLNNKENISSYDHCAPVKTISCQTDESAKSEKHFKTSPTSAFTKYTNGTLETNLNRALTPIPTFEFEKNDDDYSRPMKHDSHAQGQDTNINRYPLISLSNLSLCSSVSIDMPDERLKNCKSADKAGHGEPDDVLPQRSVSANAEKLSKMVKKNLKMENLLYGTKEQNDMNSTYTTSNKYANKYDEKLEKLNSLLDGDSFDLMKSFSEFENVLQNASSDSNNDTYTVRLDSPVPNSMMKFERDDSLISKMSTDSAYNSLNRKSPALSESQKFYGKTSTPETDNLKSSTFSLPSDFPESNLAQEHKLSKYCHECGAKYPLDIAKFCCECGVRRLVL